MEIVYVTRAPMDNDKNRSAWLSRFVEDAEQHWDRFYMHHEDRFFKDRHYLLEEFPNLITSHRHLEVGCGVGNAACPLRIAFERMRLICVDFSKRAVETMKKRTDYDAERMESYVCNVCRDELLPYLGDEPVDSATFIFVLSAMHPEDMKRAVSNVASVMRIGGMVYVRDYATGDLTHRRFGTKTSRNMRKLSENFYVRGDGTCVYYFSPTSLCGLFETSGFRCVEPIKLHAREIINRKEDLVMERKWIQGCFQYTGEPTILDHWEDVPPDDADALAHPEVVEPKPRPEIAVELERLQQMDERLLSQTDTLLEEHYGASLRINQLSHSFQGSGMHITSAARVFCSFIRLCPLSFAGHSICELGGGCGLCTLVVALAAPCKRLICTDGSRPILNVMEENMQRNFERSGSAFATKIPAVGTRCLAWENQEDLQALTKWQEEGFGLVFATEIFSNFDASDCFFRTAERLMAPGRQSCLMLAHSDASTSKEHLFLEAGAVGLVPAPLTVREHNAWIQARQREGGAITALYKFRRC